MKNILNKNSLQSKGLQKIITAILVTVFVIGLTGKEIISYQENSSVDNQLHGLKDLFEHRFAEKATEWDTLALAYSSALSERFTPGSKENLIEKIHHLINSSKIRNHFAHFLIFDPDKNLLFSTFDSTPSKNSLNSIDHILNTSSQNSQHWLIQKENNFYLLDSDEIKISQNYPEHLIMSFTQVFHTHDTDGKVGYKIIFLKEITENTLSSLLFPDTHLAGVFSNQTIVKTFQENISAKSNDFDEFDIQDSEYHIIKSQWQIQAEQAPSTSLNFLILAKEPKYASMYIFYLILGSGSLLFLISLWLILGRWVQDLVRRIKKSNETIDVLRREVDNHTIVAFSKERRSDLSVEDDDEGDELEKLEKIIVKSFDEIRLQDDFLTRLLNNIHGGILVESPDRNVLFVNSQFGELFKIPFEVKQLLGLSCTSMAQQQVSIFKDGENFLKRVEQILKKKEIIHQEKIEMTDGRFFSRDFIPINFEKGIGYIWIYKDITSIVNFEIEKELNQMRNASSAKLSALGEMAGGIAHEINNPLAVIMTRIQLLQKMLLSPDKHDAFMEKIPGNLDVIYKTSERIAKIVKGLRSIVRNSENDPFAEASLQQIFDDVNSISLEKLKMKLVKINFIFPSAQAMIKCRASQIAQVVLNLLNNSVDAIEQSENPWIEIVVEESNIGYKVICTDSGPGIPPAVATKLMQPFFTTKEVGKGTGLGLSISKGIVESHGGKFYYDETCKNTRFIFELPKDPESVLNI